MENNNFQLILYTKDNTLLVQPILKENISHKICDVS